ncbi:hypothetical protein C8R42DRAFT_712550 [Lentinula raphanica]|nr:hypothetical protein C8R42DRAFT_712550 [Lentinula raphanica]
MGSYVMICIGGSSIPLLDTLEGHTDMKIFESNTNNNLMRLYLEHGDMVQKHNNLDRPYRVNAGVMALTKTANAHSAMHPLNTWAVNIKTNINFHTTSDGGYM